ncbi:MAG: glyoxalase [Chloroflexi bacterium]|nr:glyoxalase [Chloroflexota bacterium]
MIRRLHHIQITIPKGEEAAGRAFYCDLLGLPEVPKPPSLRGRGGFWVQLGDLQLHIGTEDGIDRAASKAHLAYEVADLGAWRARFAAQGVAFEFPEGHDPIPIPGHARFQIRDPFGNRVEFIQPLPDATQPTPPEDSQP